MEYRAGQPGEIICGRLIEFGGSHIYPFVAISDL
jgi:hypothetical protein